MIHVKPIFLMHWKYRQTCFNTTVVFGLWHDMDKTDGRLFQTDLCGYCVTSGGAPAESALWRLGERVWPVGGLRVARHVPSRLVWGHGLQPGRTQGQRSAKIFWWLTKKMQIFNVVLFSFTYVIFLIVEQVQQVMPTQKMSKEQKKRKGKTQIYKGPRKSKKTG